jgi:cytochrome P450
MTHLYLGSWPVLLLNEPSLIGKVLVEQGHTFEKSPMLRRHLRPILGDGLLTVENAPHTHNRKLIAPAFQHRRIATYADVMVEYTERTQARWADHQTIDIAHEMMQLTLWIVGKTLFDADVIKEAEAIGTALTEIQHYGNAVANSVIDIPFRWPLPRNQRTKRALARLHTTINTMIEARRASGTDHGDVLSMLLHAQDEETGHGMPDHQIRDEALTLFLAGHETTAVALAWTWYVLMQHPQVYQRVRDEVGHVLGDQRAPTMEDLTQLPYTLQVFKEALRLYPPVYFLARSATQPITLGTYQVPVERSVLISPYTLHRRPDIYPDPERFDPDRWTPENEAKLPRYAYLPFSAGARNCIGSHFAMMEAHLILATLVQRVTFDLVPGQRIVPEPLITLRPKGGIRVVVKRR